MPQPRNDSRPAAGRRVEVLRTLNKETRPLSIGDIADRIGVHPNTVRFHLNTLAANGQVERVESDRRAPGRPPQLFKSIRRMDPAGPRDYRLLAEVMVDALAADPDPPGRAIEAGRAWGHQHGTSSDGARSSRNQQPVGQLVTLLDELGFAPERDDAAGQDSGRTPRVGLTLGAFQSPSTGWRHFAESDLCVAHLAPHGGQS